MVRVVVMIQALCVSLGVAESRADTGMAPRWFWLPEPVLAAIVPAALFLPFVAIGAAIGGGLDTRAVARVKVATLGLAAMTIYSFLPLFS